jgi:hypothetical protein
MMAGLKSSSSPPAPSSPFEADVKSALAKVRGALAAVVSSSGVDPDAPQEMAKRLDVDKNLAWRISRVIREPDPYAAVQHLPGDEGLKIFIRSTRKAGAAPERVELLRSAVDELGRVVEVHCGDRATLETMAAPLTADASRQQQQAEAMRKLAFRGNSAVWGVQARVQVSAHFVAPSPDDPTMMDLAIVSGLFDVRRLRADVPWAIASVRRIAPDGSPGVPATREPLDPEFAGDDVAPLMRRFCSSPLPAMRTVPGPMGVTRFELAEGAVGYAAAVTAVTGWLCRRALPAYRSADDPCGEHFCSLTTPAELVIHDLFVHEALDFAMRPHVFLCNQLPGGPIYRPGGEVPGKLPLYERLQELSSNPPQVTAPELPQYEDIFSAAMQRAGWNASQFHGFRLKMRYPPIPTLAIFRYDLPDKPAP